MIYYEPYESLEHLTLGTSHRNNLHINYIAVSYCFITVHLLFLSLKLLRETPPDGDKFASMVEVSSICKLYMHMGVGF